MEYNEMQEILKELSKNFPGSFLKVDTNEFILYPKQNYFFSLENCDSRRDIEIKVLEFASYAAYKARPYRRESLNQTFRKLALFGMNQFLKTNFTEEDIEKIYIHFGNGINHEMAGLFVDSGMNISWLQNEVGVK